MYAPLQILSAYSLLQNPNTIKQIVETAKAKRYQAIALTDINVMYGAVEFYHEAISNGIKPLFGLTLQLNGLVNTSTVFPVVLIAENYTGYQNLMWISSVKMTSEKTNVTFDILENHMTGVQCIMPMESELSQFIASEYSAVSEYWEALTTKIKHNQLYIGVNPYMAEQVRVRFETFCQDYQVNVIALDDIHYLNPDDAFTTQVLKAIDTNTKLVDINQLAQQKGSRVLKPFDMVQEDYTKDKFLTLAFENNKALVARANVELNFRKTALPKFQLPKEEKDSASFLNHLVLKGLKNHLPKLTDQYLQRVHYELSVINQLGFNDYFLIVWDIVNFAKKNNIQLGAGRGSAAGSLVAFSLGITDVDPVAFGLLFERFLNAERAQMPDIDIDWPDNRREEILVYLHQKYGQRNFAQIITFGTLAAKQSLRDTARVFGVNQLMLSKISNAVPQGKQGRKVSIQNALDTSKALENVLKTIENGKLLLRIAQQIEGLPRNYSTHAAGVVLSDEPLVQTLPVQSGTEKRLLTQFEKNPVEDLGLLKIDILGLSNLTILAQTLKYANSKLPDHFKISDISLDDKETIQLYSKGDTNGVFQFESSGIKNVLRQLNPVTFEHIVAVNALYRPGPSRNIDTFIKRRHGKEQVAVLDPSLKTILAPTFGIIVYQEQVMLVAERYAGFSLSEADVLRSAMSKKKLNKMAEMRDKFIEGAVRLGHHHAQAKKIFEYIDEFANYGFNRSHAVAYTKLSFQLAYMKAHYPLAFFTALLNSNLGSPEKTRIYVTEAKSRHIIVKPPHVNFSERFWSIKDNQLIMGLNNIKGVRTDFVTALLDERVSNGTFKTIQSFIQRMPEKFRKTDIFEKMVYAGALDSFGYNRAELISGMDSLVEAASFGDLILNETKVNKLTDFSMSEKLQREKEVIGVNLSGHPLDQYVDTIKQNHLEQITDITEPSQTVQFIGLVDNIKQTRTKKGEVMAFVTMSDMTGTISVTIFHQLYAKVAELLKTGNALKISGKTDSYNGKMSIVARQLEKPVTIKDDVSGTWFIRFDAQHETAEIKKSVIEVINKFPGNNPVIIHWQIEDKNQQLDSKFWLSSETAIIRELAPILGNENIIFRTSQ
ncbi:DNA polymerase III subunit alpha [Leuconostoc palmae]|uniref:DNA polymerase III subunit alpha n=1 Tax=Leuconostoc palmae TaxID=501487 RepID=UPI001C7D6BBD|nr:DNA polymerase III subunit alpha [Leuconostoc palmae]